MSIEKDFTIAMVDLYNQQEMAVKAVSEIDNMSTTVLTIQGIAIEKSIIRNALLAKLAEIDASITKIQVDIISYLKEDLSK